MLHFGLCIPEFGMNIMRDTIFIPLNSFLASGNFCHLLITFENSLNPQNVGRDLDPNHFTL